MNLKNWIRSLFKTPEQGAHAVRCRVSKTMLNYKDMGVTKINDSLYDLGSCEQEQENLLVIFFHGLELDDNATTDNTFLRTWTYDDNSEECWPSKMFRDDLELKESNIVIRAFATCYDSSKYRTDTGGRLDNFLVGENFVQTVIHPIMAKFQPSGRNIPIVLVAHSFGGIVIRELICHAFSKARNSSDKRAEGFLKNLGGIFFYATPHGALTNNAYNHIFPSANQTPSETGAMLSQYNKKLIRSRELFKAQLWTLSTSKEWRNQKKILTKSVFENALLRGWTCFVVEEASARIDGEITYIQADHFLICKPSTGEDGFKQNKYVLLQSFIVEVVKAERNQQ